MSNRYWIDIEYTLVFPFPSLLFFLVLSLCYFLFLSISVPVCVCLCVCFSLFLSLFLSIYLSLSLSPPLSLSLSLSIPLPPTPSLSLSLSLPLYLFLSGRYSEQVVDTLSSMDHNVLDLDLTAELLRYISLQKPVRLLTDSLSLLSPSQKCKVENYIRCLYTRIFGKWRKNWV